MGWTALAPHPSARSRDTDDASVSLSPSKIAPPSSALPASGSCGVVQHPPAPPSPFLRPRRFPPRSAWRGSLARTRVLALASRPRSWGSSRFTPSRGLPRSGDPRLAIFPGPSELSPRRPPSRVTATPLPSRRLSCTLHPTRTRLRAPVMAGWASPTATSRLFSSVESVVRRRVAAAPDPLLSWASSPSKVFSARDWSSSGHPPRNAAPVVALRATRVEENRSTSTLNRRRLSGTPRCRSIHSRGPLGRDSEAPTFLGVCYVKEPSGLHRLTFSVWTALAAPQPCIATSVPTPARRLNASFIRWPGNVFPGCSRPGRGARRSGSPRWRRALLSM